MFPAFPVADMALTFTPGGAPFSFATAVGVALAGLAGLMLTLAKKLHRLAGCISVEQLREAGYPYKPFDRRHTPNSNWPRISGLRVLNGATLGIIGVGEIGREITRRVRGRTGNARGGRLRRGSALGRGPGTAGQL